MHMHTPLYFAHWLLHLQNSVAQMRLVEANIGSSSAAPTGC